MTVLAEGCHAVPALDVDRCIADRIVMLRGLGEIVERCAEFAASDLGLCDWHRLQFGHDLDGRG